MELYLKVRLACRDGMSAREAARQFGISRESVKKMLSFSVPPGYRRTAPIKRPKLDGFTEIIDQWLGDDVGQHRKQRHTAKRVFDRLRDEHGFTGGYTIVKDYVRDQLRRRREMFVPLHHAPGHAQADFGEALVAATAVLAKATTRVASRVWSAGLGATSWCRCRVLRPGTTSTLGWRSNAASVRRTSCGAIPRRSDSGSSRICRRCQSYRRPFDSCEQATGQASSQSLVRYQTNDYSVPVAYGHRDVWVRGYVDQVVIGCGGEIIARHPRCYDREDMIFDPVHYLPLIEQKIGALDQAAPLAEWDLPAEFQTLRRLMEARMIKAGRREYVQVLRLLESFGMEDLHAAIKTALRMGAVGFDAIKHLVLCQVEKRPPKLDLNVYPYLPRATVGKTSAASYLCLMLRDAA